MRLRHRNKHKNHHFTVPERLFLLAVTGLLAFTVWYVWQGEQVKHFPPIQSSTSAAGADPLLLLTFMRSATGNSIGFLYPDTWQLERSQVQTSPHYNQVLTVTAPSGAMAVVYEVGDDEPSAACSPPVYGQLTTYAVVDIQKPVVRYVETTFTKGRMDGNLGFAGLMRTAQTSMVKAGDSYCAIHLAQIIPTTENADSPGYFSANITFTDRSIQTDPAKFAAALSGDEYEQAKAILRSTTVR